MKDKSSPKPARSYHSEALDKFMSLGSPAGLARTQNRMMVAAKIFEAMKVKGVGKKKLAEMMGVSPSVVTKWLSGDNNFRIDTLSDLERVLDFQLLDLGEKPVVENVFRFKAQLVLSTPIETPVADGKPYGFPSSLPDQVHSPSSQYYRQITLA